MPLPTVARVETVPPTALPFTTETGTFLIELPSLNAILLPSPDHVGQLRIVEDEAAV